MFLRVQVSVQIDVVGNILHICSEEIKLVLRHNLYYWINYLTLIMCMHNHIFSISIYKC